MVVARVPVHRAGIPPQPVRAEAAGDPVVAGATEAPQGDIEAVAHLDDVVADPGVEIHIPDRAHLRCGERRLVPPGADGHASPRGRQKDELLVAIGRRPRHDAVGAGARVEDEDLRLRAEGQRAPIDAAGVGGGDDLGEDRVGRRTGDRVEVGDRRRPEVVSLVVQRHPAPRPVEPDLEIGIERGLERTGEVEDALRTAEEVGDELIEVDLAVAVVVFEVRLERAEQAAVDPGDGEVRDPHAEARADGGPEPGFGGIDAGGEMVVEAEAVEDLQGGDAAPPERRADATGVEDQIEVRADIDAAEEMTDKRPPDLVVVVLAEVGLEAGDIPADEVDRPAEEKPEDLRRRVGEERKGDPERVLEPAEAEIGDRAR